jgi:hypothetical protein
MIGTKLYQRKSKVILFMTLYGILALAGVALISYSLLRNQDPSGAEGFTVIFGAGMAYVTWARSRKPRVVVGEEYLELRQQNKPEFIKYRNIGSATRTRDGRLVIGIRDGHGLKNSSILLKDLEKEDAEKLAEFCRKKGWKGPRLSG